MICENQYMPHTRAKIGCIKSHIGTYPSILYLELNREQYDVSEIQFEREITFDESIYRLKTVLLTEVDASYMPSHCKAFVFFDDECTLYNTNLNKQCTEGMLKKLSKEATGFLYEYLRPAEAVPPGTDTTKVHIYS
jgi:hypothetical protein